MTKRIVIVGGGIAGLAVAYRLRKTASGVCITLLECDNRLGGKIVTERVNGFVIEGGPNESPLRHQEMADQAIFTGSRGGRSPWLA